MALRAEPGSAAGTFRYYAEAIDKVYGEIAPTADTILALIHREPVGVVAAIVPWNFPLMIGAWKLAPALAAGNSLVLKPAETASLSLLRLAELALQAGLPPGVLNVVTGPGAITGQALGLSMGVDVLVFTGSGMTGRRLLEYSARSNLKRCFLELGGQVTQHRHCRRTRSDHRCQSICGRHFPQRGPSLRRRIAAVGRGGGA